MIRASNPGFFGNNTMYDLFTLSSCTSSVKGIHEAHDAILDRFPGCKIEAWAKPVWPWSSVAAGLP